MMKKITLLFLALICSMVGMAQSAKVATLSEPVTAPQEGKIYAIECNSQQSFTTWMYDGGDTPKGTRDAVSEGEITETKYFWKITPTDKEGVYSFQNYATDKYISIDGTYSGGAVTMSAQAQTVIISLGDGDNADYIALKHMTADQWIDMGWTGEGISTWSGEVNGSRRMQIREITLEEVSELQVALAELNSVASDYAQNHDINTVEENVGTACGNYGEEAVKNYVEALDYAGNILDNDGAGLSIEEINAAKQSIIDAWNAVVASRIPYAQEIKPGYYVIKNALDFKTSTTTEDTEDPESGEIIPGETIVTHVEKAIYADKTAAKWKTYEPKAEFLFKVEETDTPLSYLIINQLEGKAFATLSTFAETGVGMAFDYSKGETEVYPGKTVNMIYNIRLTTAAERDYNYVHAGGHYSGAGVSGSIVNWNHEDESVNASDWYLEEIDEATALAWIEAASPTKKITAMIDSINAIKTAFAAQKTIAIDETAAIDEEKQVANEETFLSPWTEPNEGSVAALFDGSASTFWHSKWSSGANQTPGTNYFVINDVDNALVGGLAAVITRRAVAGDHPTKFTVYGTNDYDISQDSGEGYEGLEWTELGQLNVPFGNNTETVTSNVVAFDGSYNYFKFVCTQSINDRGYFHMSELRVYPATLSHGATTTQATARASEIAAVEAAIEAWNNGNYSKESVTDPDDAAFVAAYNAVIKANNAWTALYADPSELRATIENASVAAKGIVIGKNPGQWPEGSNAAKLNEAVKAAENYNNTGAYSPATMQKQLDAIESNMDDLYASANQIVPGKWYKIRFATEAEYEANGWDKSGAENTTYQNLYGNVVAPAVFTTNTEDGETVYEYEEIDKSELFKGAQLRFVEDAVLDAFRFVAVGDTALAMQHETGWYVTESGALSNTPALFSSQAIGYGKSLIKVRNLDGEEITTGGAAPSYLHAQVAYHKLVAWSATAIDSRSALYIEEVSDATVGTILNDSILAGTVKFMTSPVGVKYSAPVNLYTLAGYTKAGSDEEPTYTLCFDKAAEAKAGEPVLMIVDGDIEDNEQEYVNLSLGTDIAKAKSVNGVTGTYVYQWVEEEDMPATITVYDNELTMATGEDATDCSRDISAYTASIDLRKATLLDAAKGDLQITVSGSDITAISTVVANISKAGKIYTIDGKYVGNGNINAIKGMTPGIYIINGVKVAVK